MKPDYFGKGILRRIPSILEHHKATRIFLVTGKKSYYSSGARAALIPYLNGATAIRFCDFSVNPNINDVKRGVSALTQAKCDAVIAIGGGSVIDMAKLSNIIAHHNHKPEDIATGKKKVTVKGLPLIAIPTTAGSGSEATHFAVVYVDNIKYSLSHEYILPDYSLVDPSLTYNLPPRLTAISGFDALSHAVESYWAVTSTKQSQEYASQSISMIAANLASAVNSPTTEIRDTMALAANLAGKAINLTKTTAPHAISYPITTYFNVPHGHAVALLTGIFFLTNSDLNSFELRDTRGKDFLRKRMSELYNLFGCMSPEHCSRKWYALMSTVGLETSLSVLGIHSQSDIDIIINDVDPERLSNNPVIITKMILRRQLQQIS